MPAYMLSERKTPAAVIDPRHPIDDCNEESEGLLHWQDLNEPHEHVEKDATGNLYHAPRQRSQSVQWLLPLVLILFVIADLFAYGFFFYTIVDLSSPIPDLEFRSPYRGLDDLYESGTGINTASQHKPIQNVPRVAALVSSVEPGTVYPQEIHQWISTEGTMTPLDRHLRVSNMTHTILQFRVMDYGMESCALALRLPPGDDDNLGVGASVELCALDVSRQLDPRTISWSTRPSCTTSAGILRAAAGEEVRLPEFSCKWGSLHTFEVSCPTDSTSCDIDMWAGRNGIWGVFMYQFQTI